MVSDQTKNQLNNIQKIFNLNGLNINIKRVENTPFIKKIYIDIENFYNINKLKLIIKTLENYLSLKINHDFIENILILQIEKKETQILYFNDFIYKNNIESLNNDIIFLGIDKNENKPIFKKLSDTKSFLIGGTSGSGKSSLLHQIILSYLILNKENYLILIDPKFTELNFYNKNNLKNRLILNTSYNYNDILKSLKIFENLIFSRLEKMKKKKQRFSSDKPILLIIDEFAQIFTNNKEKKKIIDIVSRCAAVGRAANCYMILTTQHPTNANINNTIRSNLQSRICLKCENIQQSKNIIESADGVKLGGPGESLLKLDNETYKRPVKQTFLNDENIIKILRG